METKESSPLHVVAFPWLAFGHMIAYLELSKRLAKRGHAITFVSTPRNIARLPPIRPTLASRIRLAALPLPAVDGLPEEAESMADIPPEMAGLLKTAFDGLAAPFSAFLAVACAGRGHHEQRLETKPDWIIIDYAQHWVPPIADEHQVPCAAFITFLAAFMAFLGPGTANAARPRTAAEEFMVPPEWMVPCTSAISFRRHEAEFIAGRFCPDSSGLSDMDRFWQMEQRCRLHIYRSCPEAEPPHVFPLLADLFGKPAVPAGLLMPSTAADESDSTDSQFADMFSWLDAQPKRSVIFVALGTEAPINGDLLRELALGLEISGLRFLWALRKPSGNTGDLPLLYEFQERVAGRGMVHTGWVPQVRVLAHGAVGAFLTHCGWGSTIESILFGLPLVMLPFVVDQGFNAQYMVERKVGVEVPRNYDDGSFDRNGVAIAVRRVMLEEEGELFACNAREMQEALGEKQLQEKYVDGIVESLRMYR